MKTILKLIFFDRLWLHLLGCVALVFDLRYWAASEYAHSTLLWPSEMMANLSNQHWSSQAFIYTIFTVGVAYVVERVEVFVSPGTKVNFVDIVASMIGGLMGFCLYAAFPSDWIALAGSIAVCGCIGYVFVILTHRP